MTGSKHGNEIKAADVRHQDVRDDQVGNSVFEQSECDGTIFGSDGLITLERQRFQQALTDHVVIFYDQYFCHGFFRRVP